MGDSPVTGRSPSPSRASIPILGRELPLDLNLSRREMLRLTGYTSMAAFLAACSSGTTPSTTAATTGGTLSIGSNQSDPGPRKGFDQVVAAFKAANGGTDVKLNVVDHGTFQDQVNSYLQGTPEDVFTWFSGHRMRFFADKGLATSVNDTWDKVKGNFTGAFAESVKGNDGNIYGVPVDYYPWALFYRKSVFAAHGYNIPTNWDSFKALCAQMQKDGLIPIAMGDKDGWPAQGTLDIINLRLNGYTFHVELCTGKQKWTDPRVANVFSKWGEITQYYSPGLAGQTWQQAADQVVNKKAGMYMLGLFVSQQFAATGNAADLADLDFFAWPNMGAQYDSEKALDAPIDIVMLSKKSPTLSKDLGQAKAFLEFFSKGAQQVTMFQATGGGNLPTANDADKSTYTPQQQKAVQLVSGAQRITQFFDRDSRPDFAGPNGMQSFLLKYLANPKQDIGALQKTMQSFWDSLPPEQ
jgi:multiple sugar transport system substrate-binding protein